MFNVCVQCGEYRADKVIDPAGPYAACPACGHQQSFRQLPLLVVSGASGTGKSSVLHQLKGKLDRVVLLEQDILWRPEFDQPQTQYRDFFETWLRLCKNIAQSGRPVVLFGAGAGVPGNLEPCVEWRYLGARHTLALTCDDEVLAERLRQRPAWRNSRAPAFIESQVKFNRWFKENASTSQPPITLLDTTSISSQETARRVAAWIDALV